MDIPVIPGLTPEQSKQLELGIRLEAIFMPHARMQRDQIYERRRKSGQDVGDVRLRFVHYTSAEAALNIIRTKRIWMRNTTCMSDYREVQHGFQLLHKFFADEKKTAEFTAALDASVPGAAKEAIGLFNGWWQTIQIHTYITSISEHDDDENAHGRLSMWRAFGGNAPRVALIFKVPYYTGAAAALNLLFSPVAYLTEPETETVFRKVISNMTEEGAFLRTVERPTIVATVFNMLLAGVTCLKHEGFREEREWRAIYSPKIRPSPLMETATEVVAGVPQPVYKIPFDKKVISGAGGLDMADVFDQLIIGPSQYPMVMSEAFADALKKIGVQDAEQRICASLIPIRS